MRLHLPLRCRLSKRGNRPRGAAIPWQFQATLLLFLHLADELPPTVRATEQASTMDELLNRALTSTLPTKPRRPSLSP